MGTGTKKMEWKWIMETGMEKRNGIRNSKLEWEWTNKN